MHCAFHCLLHSQDVAPDMVCQRASVPFWALPFEGHILPWQALALPVQVDWHAHMLVLQKPAPRCNLSPGINIKLTSSAHAL